jgi:ADP-ribose pyrophosphatase
MKIIKTETMLGTKYLSFNKTDYADRSGKIKTWIWAQRPGGTKAVVIAATLGDCLVMIREFRIPVGDYVWELPAGLVDPGEDPVEAGRREFQEETGLGIEEVIRVSPAAYSSPGLSDEATYLMFARAVKISENVQEAKKLGSSEDIETLYVTKEAAQDLINNPDIKIGTRAYLVLLSFVAHGTI